MCRNQLSQKIPRNSPKLFFTGRLPEPEGHLEVGPRAPEGCQARPLATLGGPLGDLDHLSGSPSVFRSLRPRNGDPSKDFPKYDRSSADTRSPSLGFRSSCSGTLPGRGLEGRLSPSSSPTPLHQPSMIPPSMCEKFPAVGRGDDRVWM